MIRLLSDWIRLLRRKSEGVRKEEVPSEYRKYVSTEDLVRLSKAVKVYADERGRLYIDVRELRE